LEVFTMRARLTLFSAALASIAALALLVPACDNPGNADADGDGYLASEDCDDTRADVHPGGIEECSCDGLDDDCNGVVDDFECALQCSPPQDADGDGFEPPEDCNDQDPTVNPAAEEPCLCDSIDQDCSGAPQDFACDMVCHFDKDNDGFDDTVDCDDNNGGVNPNAAEKCECDSVDQNCNKTITDFPADCVITCTDTDGDGFFAEGDDCNDNDKGVHPGAAEACLCDAIDQDCNGDPLNFTCDLACIDADADGVLEGPDCDDGDATVKPSPDPEACACDGKDSNCNGTVDDFDAACAKTCTYLNKGDMCTSGMEPACGNGLACCMPAAGGAETCIDKCVGDMCMNGCPLPP
jgi:hypothetical protein